MSSSTSSDKLYDIIGLGFGPANLSIAGAILDKLDRTDHVRYELDCVSHYCHGTQYLNIRIRRDFPWKISYSLRSKRSFDGIPVCYCPGLRCRSGSYLASSMHSRTDYNNAPQIAFSKILRHFETRSHPLRFCHISNLKTDCFHSSTAAALPRHVKSIPTIFRGLPNTSKIEESVSIMEKK